MTRTRASAVHRSRIPEEAKAAPAGGSPRSFRRGSRRRWAGGGRPALGVLEEPEEAVARVQHERGRIAVERVAIGLQRTIKGKEFLVLTESVGIDLDRLGVAVAAHLLRVALRIGEDH